MHERKRILVEVEPLDLEVLTLSEAIKKLEQLADMHGNDATIEMQDSWQVGRYLAVFKYVPETDEQMNSRVTLEAHRKQQQDEQEKRQLAALLAKHGVPNAK